MSSSDLSGMVASTILSARFFILGLARGDTLSESRRAFFALKLPSPHSVTEQYYKDTDGFSFGHNTTCFDEINQKRMLH